MSEIIKDYLNSIARYPLLTAEQEIQLGRRVARWRELREKEEPLTALERSEFRSGERARQRFIQSNLQLVVHVARRFQHKAHHMQLLDIVQEGNIGLATAVDKFDYQRGYKFSTYAYWWIRQGIMRGLYQYEATIRLPICVHEKLSKASKAAENLTKKYGRKATIAEIAKEINTTETNLSEIFKRSFRVTSLDLAVGDNDNGTIGSTIVSTKNNQNELSEDEQIMLNEIMECMEHFLDQRTKEILLSSEYNTHIAKKYGISTDTVRNIKIRGLQRLRMLMADPLAETPLQNAKANH